MYYYFSEYRPEITGDQKVSPKGKAIWVPENLLESQNPLTFTLIIRKSFEKTTSESSI
jgi:hypothetical protein